MIHTADTTTRASDTTARPPKRAFGDMKARVAGAGAIGFVVTVIAQNIIRGASAPANGATNTEVLTHYTDHRSVTFVLVATFLLSGIGLAVFLGGAMRHLIASERRAWALTGYVGGIGIMALFSLLVAAEQALTVVASRDQPDLGAIEGLWALHNSIFTVLWLSIAVALVGLSPAGVAAGITPRAFERLAPVGAALLVVASSAGPSIAAGDSMALFGLGAAGFVIWLAFLVTTGMRLVRSGGGR